MEVLLQGLHALVETADPPSDGIELRGVAKEVLHKHLLELGGGWVLVELLVRQV